MGQSPIVDFMGPHPAGVKEGRIMAFADYHDEIYFDGLHGVVPSLPMTFDDLEPLGEAAMPPAVRSYVVGGAGNEYPAGQRHCVRAVGPRPTHDGQPHPA